MEINKGLKINKSALLERFNKGPGGYNLKLADTLFDVKGSYHQTLLNIGYDDWQINDSKASTKNEHWGYIDMIEHVEKEYGIFMAWAILIGKYNQQVCNGGHYQYHDNGYDGMEDDFDCILHTKLIDWTEIYKDRFGDISEEFLDILNKYKIEEDDEEYIFETCDSCYGSGGEWEEDENGEEEWVKCCNWCEDGEVEVENYEYGNVLNIKELEYLDKRYYEIDEKVLKIVEEICKEAIGDLFQETLDVFDFYNKFRDIIDSWVGEDKELDILELSKDIFKNEHNYNNADITSGQCCYTEDQVVNYVRKTLKLLRGW